MNKKQIIQIIIIIVVFSAAGLILYNGLFKNKNDAALLEDSGSPATQGQPQELLPNGNTLDFGPLSSQNFYYNQVDYPKLDPSSDYGIPDSSLFPPPPLPPSK
jgi:flagellar basal body-associated protein FliL